MAYTANDLKKACAKEIAQAAEAIAAKLMKTTMNDLEGEVRVMVEMKAKQCLKGWLNDAVLNTHINMQYNAHKA